MTTLEAQTPDQTQVATADALIITDLHVAVVSVNAVHVIAFLIRHHFERQFVVISQEQRPLARFGNGRGEVQDFRQRITVFHAGRHDPARHDREMEGHMTLVGRASLRGR
mgnify:CR=1 FL=1